jgi:hypothetical protein
LVVDVQDVAVGIFEPGGLELSGDVDVAFAPETWRISLSTPQVADVALLV